MSKTIQDMQFCVCPVSKKEIIFLQDCLRILVAFSRDTVVMESQVDHFYLQIEWRLALNNHIIIET